MYAPPGPHPVRALRRRAGRADVLVDAVSPPPSVYRPPGVGSPSPVPQPAAGQNARKGELQGDARDERGRSAYRRPGTAPPGPVLPVSRGRGRISSSASPYVRGTRGSEEVGDVEDSAGRLRVGPTFASATCSVAVGFEAGDALCTWVRNHLVSVCSMIVFERRRHVPGHRSPLCYPRRALSACLRPTKRLTHDPCSSRVRDDDAVV